jgi:hypothetical protein
MSKFMFQEIENLSVSLVQFRFEVTVTLKILIHTFITVR